MAGPSSRKRSHADMSHSESPSSSPTPRSKRRRISAGDCNSTTSPIRDPPPSSPAAVPTRYQGDGLDFRRPIMTSTTQHGQQIPMIDLTADDDYPTPALYPIPQLDYQALERDRHTSLWQSRSPGRRAPPFGRSQTSPTPEIIDLVTDSDGMDASSNGGGGTGSSRTQHAAVPVEESSDIIFVGSRPQVNLLPNAIQDRRLPTPPALRNRAGQLGFMQYMHRGIDWVSGRDWVPPPMVTDEVLDRIDGLPAHQRPTGPREGGIIEHDDYINLALDYRQPGFEMFARDYLGLPGGEPGRSSTPPEIVDQEPYKAPPAAQSGYSRNLLEDDVVICPCCKDELALGDDDMKQQIWVAKLCGHVYCGSCATNRIISKGANKREKRKAAQRKVTYDMKACMVDGCKTKLSTKNAMFQIYL